MRGVPTRARRETEQIAAGFASPTSTFAFAVRGIVGGIDAVEAALCEVLPHLPVDRRPVEPLAWQSS
ncbi:MAG: hypothetical protein JXA67_07540 [Micromonosporaceae bacterium]|nr:hypothetical protein [Micromonosporaceae bacterium]